ncbi:unnamed protein product [Chrysoparadoxa australica]
MGSNFFAQPLEILGQGVMLLLYMATFLFTLLRGGLSSRRAEIPEIMEEFTEDWPVESFNLMAHAFGVAAWCGQRMAEAAPTNFTSHLNAGVAIMLTRTLTYPATRTEKWKSRQSELKPPFPPMLSLRHSFVIMFKVQLIWALAIMLWVALAGGRLYAGHNYLSVGFDALLWWLPGNVGFSFSWPKMPQLGQISFALSLCKYPICAPDKNWGGPDMAVQMVYEV